MKSFKLLMALVALGFLFRMWFIGLAPQPYGWDQYEYDTYAHKMLEAPSLLASHTYRNYPYPLFLASIYTIFGIDNHHAVFMFQAAMDSLVIVFLYLILRSLHKPKAAWIAAALYACNPFSSGYVGVVLSEVFTIFFITASLLLGILFVQKPGILRGVLFGVAVGIASEARSAALVWGAIPIIAAVFFVKNKVLIASTVLGVFLAMVYPLWVNWRDYKEVTIATVDSAFPREFYQGVLLRRLPPFTYVYPQESFIMWNEYHSEWHPEMGTPERKAMADKYMKKAWDLIAKNPMEYVRVRFEKMWYVWQKENVFFYQEPGFEHHKHITFFGNIVFFCVALFGIATWKKNTKESSFVWWVVVGSLVYATVAFSFTHAEYRLTIPFYSLLFIAAAAGVSRYEKK